MLFQLLFQNTGMSCLHSPDLSDMRQALLDEDDDGPDGGSPFTAQVTTSAGPLRDRLPNTVAG